MNPELPPTLADAAEDERTCIVDKLLQHRVRAGEHQYLESSAADACTWEPESEMPPSCVREFWRAPLARVGKRKA